MYQQSPVLELDQAVGRTIMVSLSGVPELFDLRSALLILFTLLAFLVPVFVLFPPVPVEYGDALKQTHTKLGIPRSKSNLNTQRSPVHNHQPGRVARIQSLYVYPIKSCSGIELSHSKVLPKGLEFDRLYTFAKLRPKPTGPAAAAAAAVVNPEEEKRPKWEIATLRALGLLANVKVDLWLPDASKGHGRSIGISSNGHGHGRDHGHGHVNGNGNGISNGNGNVNGKVNGNIDNKGQPSKADGGFLVVRFPWKDAGIRGALQVISAKLCHGLKAVPHKEFLLPMDFPTPEDIEAKGYGYEHIQFFAKTAYGLNMQQEVPPELSSYLGAKGPIALFRIDPSQRREVFRNAPKKENIGYQPVIDFQDGYPLHLLSLTSIRALESRIRKDDSLQFLDARRFRANIIVSGLQEYDEDDWRSIQIRQPSATTPCGRAVNFDVSARTVRCKLPNVDPATGLRHNVEPDNALRKFRNIDDGAPKNGCFGMQLCPLFADAGRLEDVLEVGMEIHVLERGSHFAI